MFVVLLSYVKPLAEIDALRPAHLEFLDTHYASGLFVASGRQVPLTGGVIIANAASREKLEAVLKEDPFHTEQVATYQIIEFTANKYHPALAPLFAA